MKPILFIKVISIRMILLPINAMLETYNEFRSEWEVHDRDDYERLNHMKRDLETIYYKAEAELAKK